MSTYTVRFYDGDPIVFGFTGAGGSFAYSGPASPEFEALITDTQAGVLGQTLSEGFEETATATITRLSDGVVDNAGKRVAAVNSYTLRDTVTGDLFEAVKLRVYGVGGFSGANYTMSELPLVPGRTYDVVAVDSSPNAGAGDPVFTYSQYVCLVGGTPIDTPEGPRPVEDLRPGDTVTTLDQGPQVIVWSGRRKLALPPGPHPQKPILLPAGCLGPGSPRGDIALSPQHRVLLRDAEGIEVLGPAKGLLPLPRVRRMEGRRAVIYHSFALGAHGIVFADGAPVETFWPGRVGMRLLAAHDRTRLDALFPGILVHSEAYGPPARPLATRCETAAIARMLRAARFLPPAREPAALRAH